MSGARYTPNPEIATLARRIVHVLNRELEGSLLSAEDQAAVLLAAAHGRASSLSRERLMELAVIVWGSADEGKRRESRSLDFNVESIDRKGQNS